MQIKKVLSFIALLVIVSVPILILADAAPDNTTLPDVNVQSSISNIGNWLFYFLIVLGGIFIIVSAFQFLTAGGNPDAVTRARNTLTYAVVGIALGVLAKGIVELVQKVIKP